jgi:hypothetical protein
VKTPMARVSRRRCSKSAKLSVGVAGGGGLPAGAVGAAAECGAAGAAPVRTGRESLGGFGLPELEAAAALDASPSLGGSGGAADGGGAGDAGGGGSDGAGSSGEAGELGGTALDAGTSGVARGALGFIDAQPASRRKTVVPAITNRYIEGSKGYSRNPTPRT